MADTEKKETVFTTEAAESLIRYINSAVTPYHAVLAGKEILKKAGFKELLLNEEYKLEKGGKYYTEVYGTALVAFTIGKNVNETQNFHVAAAHTDYPCMHVKPKAELGGGKYFKINVETYGGPILNTWLDRPLSIAGRVSMKGKDVYHPETRIIDFKKPVAVIPNLAIHMNRGVNDGIALNKQVDMMPVLGMVTEKFEKDNYFVDMVAKHMGVNSADILDFDLYVYNSEEGCLAGIDNEFISAPRIDNLSSCHSLLMGITSSEREDGINVTALFDHEEIGSRTKTGANSALLSMILEKIYSGLGFEREKLNDSILGSFLFSVDVAHALHPNHGEKYDPSNQANMNEGIVIKINSNQSYTFDTKAVAVTQALCDAAGVKYQKFVNRSDMVGGSTLGPIISSWLPMTTVDIGVPILAMHSARELMGVMDQHYMTELMKTFFKNV